MSRGSGLIRRKAVWYVLVTVPTDLWLAMGSTKPVKQRWVSLRTTNREDAKARKHKVLDQWAGTFADM
ncbi:MAG: hypothetical protein JWQ22_2275, partial [Devosia sp.]|nr:hypothetical protein [Devosia sp.]